MKFPIYSIAVPILAGAAFAQDTPPVQPKQPQESPQSTSPARTPTESTAAQPTDKTSGQSADRLPEMKTQSYSGTLVDASCAGAGSGSAATAPTSSTKPAPNSADRSVPSTAERTSGSGSSQSCTLSASATQFALQMKDGQTVRFDDVGNTRAQEAIKNKKKWSEAIAANKPLRVKISAVLSGDKLTVMSVD